MTTLSIYAESDSANPLETTTDAAHITTALAGIGVAFERWQASFPLPANASQDDVLKAYADDIARLTAKGGYQSKDVARITPDHPDRVALRAKFLSEHVHADDEVRFFVEGSGTFFLHADGKVFALLAEQGDLINVPAGAPHWFDTGEKPFFTAIRLFTSPNGWEAKFTNDPVATRFTAP